MIDPAPAVPEGAGLWPLVIAGITSVLVTVVPAYLGHRSAAKTPPPPDPLAPNISPAPPSAAEPAKAVVADLVTRQVAVVEGSPEWALVHMVNSLERRTDEIEARAEERDREAQERYDELDRRWQKRYSALERSHTELLRENAHAVAEGKALRTEVSNLRAEVHTLRGRLGGTAL